MLQLICPQSALRQDLKGSSETQLEEISRVQRCHSLPAFIFIFQFFKFISLLFSTRRNVHLKCKKENPILSCYGCVESDSILNIFNQSRTYNLLEMMYGHISRINLAYLSLFICIAVTRIPICTSFEEMKLVDSYPPRHPIYKFFKAEGDSSKVSNVKCVEHNRFFFLCL